MQDLYEANVEGVRSGDVLAGKYRIERVLGMGGMGVVVAARHLQLDEMVAIKYLLPTALEHPTAVSRFIREAKAAVRIKSEHVARVSDVGTLSNGAPYLVMEYLEGQDLAQWLKQSGPLEVDQAVEFVLQALEAIADAHGLGIIHRDLKPANLYCVRRSDGILAVKVLDFGISKTSDLCAGEVGAITAPAAIMGSPLYMSPEQMRSARDVDVRTDIWAIGVILYQLTTGVAPFAGRTISEICEKATTLPPTPPRSLRPELPHALEAVILRCLEKNRDQRYANVAELAVKLMPFAPRRARSSVERISRIIAAARNQPSIAESVPESEAQPLHLQTQTNSNFGHTKSRVQLSRGGRLGVGAAVIGAAVTLLLWFFASDPVRTTTSSPALTGLVVSEPAVSSVAVLVTPVPSASSEPNASSATSLAAGVGVRGAAVSTSPSAVAHAKSASSVAQPAHRAPATRSNTLPQRDLFDSPH
jgi:eukaryotic-like serine/threonine-protein kinase